MSKLGEEDVDYESDPEEEKRLLGMRRREAASDDEEGEAVEKPRMDRNAPIHFDESDGQGGAADYYEEDEELEGEEVEEEVYEDEEEDELYEEEDEDEIVGFVEGKERSKESGRGDVGVEVKEKMVDGSDVTIGENNVEDGVGEDEEGKKDNEPFAVPTAGAFYMHDDRFRDNAGGRHRRTYGGRKLWESKDDKKWGHDKFEEMNSQEKHFEQGRKGSKGHYQARGWKNQGPDRGYARSKGKTFSNGNNQIQAPKVVRGRGPRKYENRWKRSNQAPPAQNKQPEKSFEKTSDRCSGRAFTPATNTESDHMPPARKLSSLSSASPPFYPSGKDIKLTQKRDIQAASTSRNLRTSGVDESFSMQQTGSLMQGKNIADSVGVDKLYIDDSITSNAGKPFNSIQMSSSVSSLVNTMQASQSRNQGRGVAISGQITYQATHLQNQPNRPTTQPHPALRNPASNHVRSSVRPPPQQLGQQRSGSGSQSSSPPKTALSINSYEPGDVESSSESSKSRGALTGKGKGTILGGRRGSFMYGGPQVMGTTGSMGTSHGDQNFPATPAFLPVMQFGGQHPGGIRVPTLGMAFPGYVANPELGLGNSEMTWLPVLAGAAGALGATNCSPYITVDGAYHAHPSGQTSSVGSSSKESNTDKSNNELKPSQRPELVNDELGRQKPRRYSEMDFKQPSTSA